MTSLGARALLAVLVPSALIGLAALSVGTNHETAGYAASAAILALAVLSLAALRVSRRRVVLGAVLATLLLAVPRAVFGDNSSTIVPGVLITACAAVLWAHLALGAPTRRASRPGAGPAE